MGASKREMKALVAAMAVESNYQHERYSRVGSGDRDSVGVLQQRPSMGWGPPGESVEKDASQFLNHAQRINRKGFRGSAGQLAQAVQRSAFPGRYDERGAEAERYIRQFSRSGGSGDSLTGTRSGRPVRDSYRTETVPGVDRSADRLALKQQYVLQRDRDPNALLMLKQGLDAAQDTPESTRRVRVPGSREGDRSTSGQDAVRGGSTRSYGREGEKFAGSQGKIIPFSQQAHRLGLKTTSAKRGTKSTASGGTSDHYIGKRNATARDWAGPPEQMDKLARSIAGALGARDFRGGVLNVTRGKFRYQLLWKTNVGGNHYDHVHLGVQRVK